MLELVLLILITFLTAVFVVGLYRLASNWLDPNETALVKPSNTTLIKLRTQQGFVTINSVFKGSEESKAPRKPIGNLKTPWGW